MPRRASAVYHFTELLGLKNKTYYHQHTGSLCETYLAQNTLRGRSYTSMAWSHPCYGAVQKVDVPKDFFLHSIYFGISKSFRIFLS